MRRNGVWAGRCCASISAEPDSARACTKAQPKPPISRPRFAGLKTNTSCPSSSLASASALPSRSTRVAAADRRRTRPIYRAIAAIGLPVRSGAAGSKTYDYSFLADCTIPKLFLSGDRDRYTSTTELIQVAAAAAPPSQVALVPGADHFFTGHLENMQTTLSGWLKELAL